MITAVNTSRYQASHSKQPRGYGYWMFETKSYHVIFTGAGTYSEMKRAAIKAAGDSYEIFVCP